MSLPTKNTVDLDDTILVKLAREIAMNIFDLETILTRHEVDKETWLIIQDHPHFSRLLQSAVAEWESATNTQERVKAKAGAMIELWLAHASELLHGDGDASKKTELAKFIARLADMGLGSANVQGGGGERLSVIINLGADTLKIEKDVTPKVIEHDGAAT